MDKKSINNKGQAKIFAHPFLEMLSKTRPWVIYSLYIPVNIFLIYYSWSVWKISITLIGILLIAGIFSWTLFEYLAHRFLFHYKASSKFGQRLVYIFHENHHEFPRDKSRLFMPPLPSIIMSGTILGIFCGIFYLVAGAIGAALIFFVGFITGYLIYVSIHYAIHTHAAPKYFKVLWRNHYLHHYKNREKAFGVSSILWDKIFGTLPKESD